MATAEQEATAAGTWFVYMLRCADETFYTGVTKDLVRRIREHNTGRQGARYTRSRRPVTLVFFETAADRSGAARREAEIKRLDRRGKNALVEGQENLLCRTG